MPSQEEFDELKGRIVELENQLKARATAREPELTPDEIKAFLKVRDLLAVDWGDMCGPTDCYRPQRCVVVPWLNRFCQMCVTECTCGPCLCGPAFGGGGGVSRFGALGAQ